MGKTKKAGKRKAEEEAGAVAAGSPGVDDKAAKKKAKMEKKAKKAAKKAAKAAAAAAAAAPAPAPAPAPEPEAAASPEKKDKKKKKKDKKEKKAKKKAKKEAEAAAAATTDAAADAGEASSDDADAGDAADAAPETPAKAATENPANNPEGITRVFVGNLSWSVDEDGLREFAKPGVITDIHWVTEKETGKFLGRGFAEFETAAMAGAFLEKAGQTFMEREIRIDLAQPRANKGGAGNNTPRPLSEKPEGCTTVFVGNLSFNIDDPNIHELCTKNDIPAPTNIRWLTDRDTGKFKGCGFIDFEDTTSVDAFVKLNGSMLLERALRVDYAAGRKNTPRKGGAGGGARPLSEKPEGCVGVFLGNLSYDIEDDDVYAKAKEVGCGEPKKIRWLTDRESGEFKGCGFVDFYTTEDVDKFVTLNGKDLKGRSLRVDYAKPRPPRE